MYKYRNKKVKDIIIKKNGKLFKIAELNIKNNTINVYPLINNLFKQDNGYGNTYIFKEILSILVEKTNNRYKQINNIIIDGKQEDIKLLENIALKYLR